MVKGRNTLSLENGKVKCSVNVEEGQLVSDRLEAQTKWIDQFGSGQVPVVETDADFALDLMYTDWEAPGKANNADNLILLTKKDFVLVDQSTKDLAGGAKELALNLKGKQTPFELRIIYQLGADAFYVRRNVAVMDSKFGHHFLRWFWPRKGVISGVTSVVKKGDFGQPIAFLVKGGGGFVGLEYPTSENRLEGAPQRVNYIECGQEFGERIGKTWLQSEWVVEALTPNSFVRNWFFKYVDEIRVASLRPYTLYNSWYDLRAPEFSNIPQENIMSEQSAMKMIGLLRKNMIEKHKIKLDAFVLDDGWDVYESDWVLRPIQFPNGLRPLSDELKKTGTSLGVWFGPIGGYSFSNKRLGYMKEHGYEIVGNQLCVAGKKYGELFKKRVTDFVINDGVGYYKWDGIQFSCSEPDHGHAVDVYSRRAVMESVIDWCKSVREKNPDIFLNITSGTWLSPWWVKYANTIWMQGQDYGYADVPSIGQRDGAITYKDFVLYEDFRLKDLWFPISNLMTHGIIKGKLELLGTLEEPLDKFTDDALIYLARGVSMYELYVSPDILSEGEWNSISTSIAWAKDRFSILRNTEMIGGNPTKRETYGYTHFSERNGIIVARNPFIQAGVLRVNLAPSQGLDQKAASLVLERVYPTRWISPKLYKSGDNFEIKLDGYETAIYEIYPIEAATTPLIAGAMFDVISSKSSDYKVLFHNTAADAKILNPSSVRSISSGGKDLTATLFSFRTDRTPEVVTAYSVKPNASDKSKLDAKFSLSETATEGMVAILLTPDDAAAQKVQPVVSILDGGNEISAKTEKQEGKSQWYMATVQPGKHILSIEVKPGKDEKGWKGKAFVWLISKQKQSSKDVAFVLNSEPKFRPMPPHPWNPAEVRKNVKLGEAAVVCRLAK
jgi:hypothetical protein